jgi:hypothetical protein
VLQGVHDEAAAEVERRLRELEIFETGLPVQVGDGHRVDCVALSPAIPRVY